MNVWVKTCNLLVARSKLLVKGSNLVFDTLNVRINRCDVEVEKQDDLP